MSTLPSTNPYEDPESARLYDAENSGREDVEFYRRLARELRDAAAGGSGAPFTVLDIGCGTGVLGVDLAADGHRVIGVDPAGAMLEVARTRPGGERATWILGSADAAPEGEADLAVMTGHAAQQIAPRTRGARCSGTRIGRCGRAGCSPSRAATPDGGRGSAGHRRARAAPSPIPTAASSPAGSSSSRSTRAGPMGSSRPIVASRSARGPRDAAPRRR
ncbi:methyltransferase domain-containing protein [Brachybacterium sp. MASK1Z-5]|uniref:Methyltransferase domain-containing protein n=1 Tax=Brachybacterium halotolerans TaxID=2795215 RepID=A0ABS1BAP5_9MICO|nr:methyltransferase domain-containing protein [Brachybacterium halotolerans]